MLPDTAAAKVTAAHLSRTAHILWGRRRTCRSGWVWCVANVVDTPQRLSQERGLLASARPGSASVARWRLTSFMSSGSSPGRRRGCPPARWSGFELADLLA